MYQHTRFTKNRINLFQKFRDFDYILLTCILLLGLISLMTMYSTDGGKILFHTKSHFTKLIVFTIMMLIFSFINIKILVLNWIFFLCYSYCIIGLDVFIWNKVIRITKMDRFILYKPSTF